MDVVAVAENPSAGNIAMLAVDTALTVAPVPGLLNSGALKVAEKVVEAAKDVEEGVHAAEEVRTAAHGVEEGKSLRRSYIRNSTRQAVEDAAPRTEEGRPIDPNTIQPIDGSPDLGHKPGQEFRKAKAEAEANGQTQRQFNDSQNDPTKYQLEDPSSNRSHKYEQQ